MTPLEIEILLHYHYSPTDFRNGDFSAPAVIRAIEKFKDLGMLVPTLKSYRDVQEGTERAFLLGERGKVFVQALCDMPLPIKQWVMPKDSE